MQSGQHGEGRRLVLVTHCRLQNRQRGLDPGPFHDIGPQAENLGDIELDDLLVLALKRLVQLLAGPDTGETDRNVGVGALAGHADHGFGDLEDRHGLAHVEHIDGIVVLALAPFRIGGRHDDEVDGLGHGHEIARHAPVGDGDGAACLDLRLEDGRHRSV